MATPIITMTDPTDTTTALTTSLSSLTTSSDSAAPTVASQTDSELSPATTYSSPADEEGLFSADLVSAEVASTLPENYTLRSLRRGDFQNGFLDCLRVLTTVGDISDEECNERYDWLNTQGKGSYYLLVIDDGKRVVGTGALIVERKL